MDTKNPTTRRRAAVAVIALTATLITACAGAGVAWKFTPWLECKVTAEVSGPTAPTPTPAPVPETPDAGSSSTVAVDSVQ